VPPEAPPAPEEGDPSTPPPADLAAAEPDLTLAPSFTAERWVRPDAPIELVLSRPLLPEAGRVAVFIGATDVTGLFTSTTDRLRYDPTALPLRSGENELTAYLVRPDGGWTELGRFPLKVLARGGFEQARIDPKVDVNNKGQLAEGHRPDDRAPARDTYQDLTLNAGLQTLHARDGWTVQTQTNVVGVTNEEEALRFGFEGTSAPEMDLADYLVRVDKGAASATLGHFTWGGQRHLINGFGSRGLNATVRLGSIADVSAAAMYGSSVVGWDHISGVDRRDHRVSAATLGLELVPGAPGALRLEGSLMDGSLLPLTDYSQNEVNDAEESRGGGIRLVASLLAQRLRVDAGWARSRFDNPDDPTLSQGVELVDVREESRSARYGEVSLDLLRDAPMGPSWRTTLTAAYRHERVDPLYRSVAASLQPDRRQNVYEVIWALGPFATQVAHARSRDNLDDLETILTTRSRNTSATVAVPTAGLLAGGGPAWWAPLLSWSHTRTHEEGDGVPPNSGFSESHVPDQVSSSHSGAVEWQAGRWRAGYRLSRVTQDNRQPGRENADFESVVHGVALGWTPLDVLDVGVDLSFEGNDNQEFDQRGRTRRYGLNADWRFTASSALRGWLSTTRTDDGVQPGASRFTELSGEITQGLGFLRFGGYRLPGQLFLRYSRQSERPADPPGRDLSPRTWALNSGLTFNFF
jgi:hypothetical protein